MTDHEPGCDAPRCPECGSGEVHVGVNWCICLDCKVGAFTKEFTPQDCRCDELRADALAEQAEADAEWIGELDHAD